LPLQWLRKQYHRLITDPGPASAIGGHSKIDSVQNVFMLQSDMHDLWDNYEFGINPDVSALILGCPVYSPILISKPLG
jgi:HNH endonuclease